MINQINEKLAKRGWPKLQSIYTANDSPYLSLTTSICMGIGSVLQRSLILGGISTGFILSTYTISKDIEYGSSSNVAWSLVYLFTSSKSLKRLPLTALVGLNLVYYGREMFDL